MPRFSAKDTDRADEIYEWIWTWQPEDTLVTVDLFLVYLRANTRLQIPLIDYPITPKSSRLVPMARCLHRHSIGSALALIMPGKRLPHGNDRHWFLHLGTGNSHKTPDRNRTPQSTGERLAGAGIDIHTVKVFDNYRWALAWNQLTAGFGPRYSSIKQEQMVNNNVEAPDVRPKTLTYRRLTKEGKDRLFREHQVRQEAIKAGIIADDNPELESVSEYDRHILEEFGDRIV